MNWTKKFFLAASVLLIVILTYNIYAARLTSSKADLSRVVEGYVKAVYARDFSEAYHWLSDRDRQKKDRETYVREQGAFTGFTLKLASKLAAFVEAQPAQPLPTSEPVKAKFKLKLPDADKLGPDVLDWDEAKLNALSVAEQDALINKIDQWHREARLPFTNVKEDFELVREKGEWRIFLNTRSGVRVEVTAKIPSDAPIRAEPAPREIVFQPGEPFTVALKVKNLSSRELRARVSHNVEPQLMAKYLGLGDCGSFVPFRLAPGKEQESSATFLVWTDIPANIEQFKMIYEFEIDKQ